MARKKRKLTAQQKKAAAERLAAARANKGATQNLSVHESIRDLPDDHWRNVRKVRQWIKTNKELRASLKSSLRTNKDRKIQDHYNRVDTYVVNMESYLRTGVWTDLFFGENMEHSVVFHSVVPAYHNDGTIKRSYGVYYPDIGQKYTKQLEQEISNA